MHAPAQPGSLDSRAWPPPPSPPSRRTRCACSDALARSAPLALLQRRLRESNARFETLRGVLPPALAPHVRPGPLDADGWTLLAANTAVAAKLRQLQPRLEAALLDGGWPAATFRLQDQRCDAAGKRPPRHTGTLVPAIRIERMTFRLQGGCSTN